MPELDLENIYMHHPPSEQQIDIYAALRFAAKKLASLYQFHCPDSRERSLAMTNLEQSAFWANASIARKG